MIVYQPDASGASALDPDYHWVYDEVARAGLPVALWFTKVEADALALSKFFFQVLFLGLGVVFLWLAWNAPVGSYNEDLFLNLSSGALFFWATPSVLRWGGQHRVLVPVVGIAFAIGALLLAGYLLPFPQAVLVGSGVALLMLILLEMMIAPWLHKLAQAHDDLRREYRLLKERQE